MRTFRFETSGRVRLRVHNPSGSVAISTHDEETTEVEISLRGAGDEDEVLGSARVESIAKDDGVDVVVEIPRLRGGLATLLRWLATTDGVEVVVRLPFDAEIDVETASADVDAEGRYAESTAKTASGSVRLAETTGDVRVKTASGSVRLGPTGATSSVHTASGSVRLASVGGPATIKTVSGRVEVDRADDRLEVHTVSGSVVVADAASDVRVDTVSGSQRILRCATGTARLRSVSGSITVGVAAGSAIHVDAQAVSGSLESEIALSSDPGADEGSGAQLDLDLHSVSGSIRVVHADSAAA